MNFWPQKYRAILGAFVVSCFAAAPSAKSCGDFRKPETHFDGVNEYGFVSYWDQLGEIKLTDGSVLPLIIGFRSDWETLSPSPHLGSGWLLGLLDAHFVQRSENAFDMISIDGYTVPFGRDPKNPSILNGAQGWKAEIKNDVVTVWAECGWKLQFTKGKISSITTPKNSVAQIRRDQSGIVNDVVEGTNVLLKVAVDAKNKIDKISLGNGQKYTLTFAEKPFIQNLNGINLVSFKNEAIGEIQMPDGTTKTFDYTPDETLQPRMTILSNSRLEPRKITWNATNRIVVSDNTWTYDVKTSETFGLNAAIQRTDSKTGLSQFWHHDSVKGQEITQDSKETTKTRKWFTSGILTGKLRSVVLMKNGIETTEYAAAYDERGNILRQTRDNVSMHRIGNQIVIKEGDKPPLTLTKPQVN